MNTTDDREWVSLEAYCTGSHVELSFIESLEENGLVQVIVRESHRFLPVDQLPQLDRLVRLHEDLGINVEGLGAITHMLERMAAMQDEMNQLRNRLRRFGPLA
ncbi:MAG: hypothetical protein J5I62_09200 [Flavobacteriales bacterium]|jgi:hypothetical protein|nr:hypothetical protein [Flavobacteriales bacterium]MEB2342133.1 hypothetical protein [Flavobacteriia bacterium]